MIFLYVINQTKKSKATIPLGKIMKFQKKLVNFKTKYKNYLNLVNNLLYLILKFTKLLYDNYDIN